MNPQELLKGYDIKNLTIGVLGGHSALDVCHGAKKQGFRTVCIAQEGREKTYNQYFRVRPFDSAPPRHAERSADASTSSAEARSRSTMRGSAQDDMKKGCIDEVILVRKFQDLLQKENQEKLRKMNTIFIHNRYFWVYFSDYAKIEIDFHVPIFGNRSAVKFEERDQKPNQYDILAEASIKTPKRFASPREMDGRLCIVKVSESTRAYERAFFFAGNEPSFREESRKMIEAGKITKEGLEKAVIEEFISGAQVNFNFFYSPLTEQLELMGTDTRRQTNLDGILRLPATEQDKAIRHYGIQWIETGHIAVTVKESLLEKAFDLGERFVKASKEFLGKEIIGPFALQGAVVAEEGKEDIVIFDVSLRIPGSPGTRFTPYSGYMYGESISYGERIAMEVKEAMRLGRLEEIVT